MNGRGPTPIWRMGFINPCSASKGSPLHSSQWELEKQPPTGTLTFQTLMTYPAQRFLLPQLRLIEKSGKTFQGPSLENLPKSSLNEK